MMITTTTIQTPVEVQRQVQQALHLPQAQPVLHQVHQAPLQNRRKCQKLCKKTRHGKLTIESTMKARNGQRMKMAHGGIAKKATPIGANGRIEQQIIDTH
jgi:hypothetical protein